LVALVSAIAIWSPWRVPRPVFVSRFAVSAPNKERMEIYETPNVAFSPDDSRVAYVTVQGSTTRLYVRNIDQLQATLMPDTEGAQSPFFSPDGHWIGFFAGGAMKKVAITGGLPLTICEAPVGRGASWGRDGSIVFGRTMSSGLYRVSSNGGTPEAITSLSGAARERTHRWPQILPDGKAVLFTIGTLDSPEYYLNARIAVQSLKNKGDRRIVLEGGTNARYLDPGYLIYVGAGGLFAVPFDVDKLAVTGQPMRVLENVATDITTGASQFTLSPNGSLAYVAGVTGAIERKLIWLDRHGTEREILAPPRNYQAARLSSDAQQVATVIGGTGDSDIWIYDLQRGTLSRLTTEQGSKIGPLWTHDGKRIVYGSATRSQGMNIDWKPIDGSGPAEALLSGNESPMLIPTSWSADEKLLLVDRLDPGGRGFDMWILRIQERKAEPWLETNSSEQWGVFSPDGRWVAYQSEESGRSEVYVQSFPGPGNRVQISTEGGFQPAWARNGRELFYRTGDKMMAVSVETQPHLNAGTPKVLFDDHYEFSDYDVAPDGAHFLMVKGQKESAPTQLNVVLNWIEEWKRVRP